jgi:hypothetical protein
LSRLAARHGDVGAEEFLQRGVLTKKQIIDTARLVQDALCELFSDTPNEKRMRRKLKEAIMMHAEHDIERQVDDEFQAQAVKLLREKIIKRAEKEKLADELVELAVQRWRGLDEDELEAVADEDTGLLARIMELVVDAAPDDTGLVAAVTEAVRVLALPFVRALAPEDLNALISGAARVCGLVADGRPAAEPLRETITLALDKTGAIRAMRKSFAGLLLGDIILRQIGKGLGIKEKLSVTDFIIFLGTEIADRQFLPEVDKDEAREVKKELESI